MNHEINISEDKETEEDFSFKKLFVPLTTSKAIHWIIVIGIVVYANMLFNGFVWDDYIFVISNPDIHSFNIYHLFGANTFNSSGYYRAFAAVYFSFLYNLFGSQSFFYHFIQLILHSINTCLLFLLFKRFFP